MPVGTIPGRCRLMGGKCRGTVEPWPEAEAVWALMMPDDLPDPRLTPGEFQEDMREYQQRSTKALVAVMAMVQERNERENKFPRRTS